MSDKATCELCGEPMPPGEEMFRFHGYSGSCPKPPLPKKAEAWTEAAAKECADRVLVGAGEATFTEIIGRHAEGMMRVVMGRVGSLEKQLELHATAARIAIEVNEQLQRRIGELEAIVAELPKTADGVPIAPHSNTDIFMLMDGEVVRGAAFQVDWRDLGKYYSKPSAALAPTSDVGTVTK